MPFAMYNLLTFSTIFSFQYIFQMHRKYAFDSDQIYHENICWSTYNNEAQKVQGTSLYSHVIIRKVSVKFYKRRPTVTLIVRPTMLNRTLNLI
jgi:hypothetical protein